MIGIADLPETSSLPVLPMADTETARARALALHKETALGLDQPVVSQVEQIAASTPARTAIVDRNRHLTYAQLASEARRFATFLHEAGVGPSSVVAVSGQRSAATASAFLALELLGGIYLPIDASWPTRRVEDTLKRGFASVVLLVGDESLIGSSVKHGAAEARCPVLRVHDAHRSAIWTEPPRLDSMDQPRYVLFTSGSSGHPKGAVVEHRGMLNHLFSKVHDLQLDGDDVVAQTASLGFDISVWQLLAPLLVGGRVHIIADDDARNAEKIATAIRDKGVTVLELVPTLIRLLLDTPEGLAAGAWPTLRWLLATGEELPAELARRWLRTVPRTRLLNAYGPTECSDDVAHHEVTQDDLALGRLPIGGPVSNTALYVLKLAGHMWQACAVGEPGELFVGGLGVGRGYVGDPERTRASFFRDSFTDTGTGRLYRTGDAVRLLPQGVLQFLGRIDRQVKIAGTRIEPGEIEAVLNQHAAVAASVVVVRNDTDDGISATSKPIKDRPEIGKDGAPLPGA
ncbi:amino acid adenylation domain-containing protein [Actinomadura sp. 9N215]|uniref:amino acid adenylation domain-containing protein n=1 Tax=Actinomadura sp. 9N215 TaxID=3375150 RepID=UPI0037978541